MPEDIGHFRVVIEGEVDKKLGDSLERGIKESSKKAGKHLETELEKSLKKVFESTSFGKFLDQNLKLSSKISKMFEGKTTSITLAKPGAVYQSMTNVEHLQPLSPKALEGKEVGGMKGLAGIVGKLGILIGAIMLIVDAVKGLAPIQAILKMLIAIIQITLYPIAQVLLSIIKPIMLLLLKYVILPFHEIMGKTKTEHTPEEEAKIKKNLEDWENFKGDVSEIFNLKTWSDAFNSILDGLATWLQGLGETFTKWCDDTWITIVGWADGLVLWLEGLNESFGKWSEEINTIISEKIESLKTWLSENWDKVNKEISKPLDKFKTWLSENWDKVNKDISKPLDKFKTWLEGIWSKIDEKILEPLNKFKTWLNNTWSEIYGAITSPLKKIFDWIKTKISSLLSSLPGGGGRNYAGASGAIVTQPTMALIGEAGPEVVIPLNRSPGSSSLPSGLGGSTIVNVSFPNMRISNDRDIDEIVAKIERAFYTNSKRSGVK